MSSFLTVPEIAQRWHCNEETVTRAIRRKELRATKRAGRWLVAHEDLAACEAKHANVSAPKKRTRRPRARRAA